MSGVGAVAGWYYADGDPPGTQRYWDGESWQGEPQAAASAGQPLAGGQGGQAAMGVGAAAATAGYGPLDWYKESWRKFADFSGRARRAEYWWFTLGNGILLGILSFFVGLLTEASESAGLLFIPIVIFGLVLVIPTIAVTVRRLHDTSKSGWFYLLVLIPFGSIVILVFMFLDSHQQPNQWGSSPKYG